MANTNKNYPYLNEWLVISWRWLVLFLLGLTIARQSEINLLITVLLSLIAVWNLAMTILAVLNVRMPLHRILNLICDFAFTTAIFIAAGPEKGDMFWIGLIVIANATLYFRWKGGLVAALLFSMVQIGYAIFLNPQNKEALEFFLIIFGVNFGIASLAGLFSHWISRYTRQVELKTDQLVREISAKAAAQSQKRMIALTGQMDQLSAELNYNRLLDKIPEVIQQSMEIISPQEKPLTSAVLLFNESHLNVVRSRGLSKEDQQLSFPSDRGILFETLDRLTPQITDQPSRDPELKKVSSLNKSGSLVSFPLSRDSDDYGVLVLAHPDKDYFNQEKTDFIAVLVRQAVSAIQNARLYDRMDQENQSIVNGDEETKAKLAAGLRDGPIQAAGSIAKRLSVAQRLLFHKPKDVAAELASLEDVSQRISNDLRHLLFDLEPQGLSKGLDSLAEKNKSDFQQNVHLEIDENIIQKLSQEQQSAVFQLVEEAVNIARIYAKAELILVRLKPDHDDKEVAVLEVLDNGIAIAAQPDGEDGEQPQAPDMENLIAAAQQINGKLDINTVPGKANRIRVLIPLTQVAQERVNTSPTA